MVFALTSNRGLRFGLLFGRHVALAFVVTAIVCALGTPRVHAQVDNWGGDIHVSESASAEMGSDSIPLTVNEGESITYYLRLTKEFITC